MPREAEKSLVRVKSAVVLLAFMACWLWLKYARRYDDWMFIVAAIIATLPWFIRCEKCKSSIYYKGGGARHLSFATFFTARRCPCNQSQWQTIMWYHDK
jgi:hypothetical protein